MHNVAWSEIMYETDPFDFDAFLARAASMQWHEILQAAERECADAEAASYARKGAVAARQAGGPEYAQNLKELLFWLRYGTKPFSVSGANWAKFRVIAFHLVEIGNLKPEALSEWAA